MALAVHKSAVGSDNAKLNQATQRSHNSCPGGDNIKNDPHGMTNAKTIDRLLPTKFHSIVISVTKQATRVANQVISIDTIGSTSTKRFGLLIVSGISSLTVAVAISVDEGGISSFLSPCSSTSVFEYTRFSSSTWVVKQGEISGTTMFLAGITNIGNARVIIKTRHVLANNMIGSSEGKLFNILLSKVPDSVHLLYMLPAVPKKR